MKLYNVQFLVRKLISNQLPNQLILSGKLDTLLHKPENGESVVCCLSLDFCFFVLGLECSFLKGLVSKLNWSSQLFHVRLLKKITMTIHITITIITSGKNNLFNSIKYKWNLQKKERNRLSMVLWNVSAKIRSTPKNKMIISKRH